MRVFKRSGKWSYDFRYKGKRYRKDGFRTKILARNSANEKYNQLTKGIDLENKIPFSDYAKDWIQTYKKENLSDKTFHHYERIAEKIEKHFQETPINAITRTRYQKFLNIYNKELSQDQLGRLHAVCKKLVESAIYDGLIYKNFTIGIEVKSKKSPLKKESDKFIEIEELKRIKQYYLDRVKHYAPSTHIILLMIETGGRFSDCINLKREDINKVKSEVFLNGTKNRTAQRYVKVSKSLIKILLDYANHHPVSIEGYLFTHKGKRIDNAALNKSIKQACINLGINRNITSHAFRHSHASYLIYKNINIYYISKRLGHADISVTLRDYGHLLKETEKEDEKQTIALMEKI